MKKNKAKFIKLPYKLMVYDIETSLLTADLFRPGEQVVRHTQLHANNKENGIICISAKWYGEKKIYVFEGENAIEEFDKLARQADVCLGKNSDRFDVKYINTARMMQGLAPFPEWMFKREDLEKQLRKYFAFPSQSLDYISGIMGFGGKEKMEFSDWVDIKNYNLLDHFLQANMSCEWLNFTSKVLFKETWKKVVSKGRQALKKMIHYNKKDVLDTEAVLNRVLPYIELKFNVAAEQGEHACKTCGSDRLSPLEIITIGKTKYQTFHCRNHSGYAGRATFKWDKNRNKVYGKIT